MFSMFVILFALAIVATCMALPMIVMVAAADGGYNATRSIQAYWAKRAAIRKAVRQFDARL